MLNASLDFLKSEIILKIKRQEKHWRGKSTVDQAVLLNQNVENCFEAKRKTGAVFVDLTAAYCIAL